MPKLIRITNFPISFQIHLQGQPAFLKSKGWEVLLLSAPGKEGARIEKAEGVRHLSIPYRETSDPIRDVRCIWKMYAVFKREKPDIVHSQGGRIGFFAMLAAKIAGVRIRIHSFSTLPALPSGQGRKRMELTWICSNATAVWSGSRSVRNQLQEMGYCPPDKLTVIGAGSSNGVNLRKFNRESLVENHLIAATMRILPAEQDFIFLVVGELRVSRGIESILEAFLGSKIEKKSRLVFLGKFDQHIDPLPDSVIRKITDHPRIVQIDWVEHVAPYLALADVLVEASSQVGFSTVLLEAGAMQVPVICSDTPGHRELIQQQKTGLIFPVNQVQVLKEAMEYAYIKRTEMQEMADRLVGIVSSQYAQDKFHHTLLEEYSRLLSEGNLSD